MIVADQAAWIIKGFGRGDEIVDWHHALGDMIVQCTQVTIASKNDVFRRYISILRRDLRVIRNLGDFALFKYLHTGIVARTRKTKRIAQRMQMPAAHIQSAAIIGPRSNEGPHFVLIHAAD